MGGPLMDLGIHCIDLLRYLCGPAVSVAALVETLVDEFTGGGHVDAADAVGERGAGGDHQPLDDGQPRAGADEWPGDLRYGGFDRGRSDFRQGFGGQFAGFYGWTGVQDYSVDPGGGPRPHVALLEAFGRGCCRRRDGIPFPEEEGLAGPCGGGGGRRICLQRAVLWKCRLPPPEIFSSLVTTRSQIRYYSANRSGQDRTMRGVFFWEAAGLSLERANPYGGLLARAMREVGVELEAGQPETLTKEWLHENRGVIDVLHLNWPNYMYTE